MIRALTILAALPCLAGCDIGNFLNPGKASREAYEYRASITTTGATAAPEAPRPTQVAEIPVPAAVHVPEPVYVAPELPASYVPPKPVCVPVHRIVACDSDGNTILLEW